MGYFGISTPCITYPVLFRQLADFLNRFAWASKLSIGYGLRLLGPERGINIVKLARIGIDSFLLLVRRLLSGTPAFHWVGGVGE